MGSQALISRILEADGYNLILASSGLEGIAKAKTEQPHLILMDINIGDLDGYEVTTKLRSLPDLERIPIIALTANILNGDRERALVAGCDALIEADEDRLRLVFWNLLSNAVKYTSDGGHLTVTGQYETDYVILRENAHRKPMTLPIILASASPRRQAYLTMLDLSFTIQATNIDETPLPHESPTALVRRLSYQKAAAVTPPCPETLIIGADTIVGLGDEILGKPTSPADAKRMLTLLRNHAHYVHSALTILQTPTLQHHTTLSSTRVTLRDYTSAEIDSYIASGDPMDKAGAYAIQNPDFAPVVQISGCYAGVVGLPLGLLVEGLAKFGVVLKGVHGKCAGYTGQGCCISHRSHSVKSDLTGFINILFA